MDGFLRNEKVFVLAATNFPNSLDSAATRSGRFDKKMTIPKPDQKARKEILNHFLDKQKKDKSVDTERLA
jgi:ATP-dependent Zn protease